MRRAWAADAAAWLAIVREMLIAVGGEGGGESGEESGGESGEERAEVAVWWRSAAYIIARAHLRAHRAVVLAR